MRECRLGGLRGLGSRWDNRSLFGGVRLAGPCPSALSPCQAPAKPGPGFPLPASSRALGAGGPEGLTAPAPEPWLWRRRPKQAGRAADTLCLGLTVCRVRAKCLEGAPHSHLLPELPGVGSARAAGTRGPVCLGGPRHVPALERQQPTRPRLRPSAACVLMRGDGDKAGDRAGGEK